MSESFAALHVIIARYVDDHQPGFVDCHFGDAEGGHHRIVEKVPVVTRDHLTASSTYPQFGCVRCRVVRSWRDAFGVDRMKIDMSSPDGVATTEGRFEFVVFAQQITHAN